MTKGPEVLYVPPGIFQRRYQQALGIKPGMIRSYGNGQMFIENSLFHSLKLTHKN
jgi:hypothetical protein